MNNQILIIGNSPIAIRHYKILKKFYPYKKIFFLKKYNTILHFNDGQFKKINNINLKKLSFFLIVICTRSNHHISYAKKFFKKSKYIFIEKPLSNNLNEAIKFYKFYKLSKNKPQIKIGYNLRFLKSLIKFKYLVNKKVLGKIFYINCYVGKSIEFWRNGDLNIAATKKNGGGALFELSHEIDYLKWIFGDLKLKYSYINLIKKFNFNVDQSVFALFLCKKKRLNNLPINLTMDIISVDPKRFCEVICEKGNISIDMVSNQIILTERTKKKKIIFSKKDLEESYVEQFKYFLKSSKQNSISDIRNSAEIIKLIDQIKKK